MFSSSNSTVHPEMHIIANASPENQAKSIPVKLSTEHLVAPRLTLTWKVVFFIVAVNVVFSVAICTILVLVLMPTKCPLNDMKTTNDSEYYAALLRMGWVHYNYSSQASIAHALDQLNANQRSLNDTLRSLVNDVDECATSTHNCHPNAVCSNNAGHFSCTCSVGYSGNGFNCTWTPTLVDISANGRHTCALLSCGAVKCWGFNEFSQLGFGGTINQFTPVDAFSFSSGVASIAVGVSHTCVLMSSGAVKCWGQSCYGQLGNSLKMKAPVDVSGLSSGVLAISAGEAHTCVIMQSRAAKCWGEGKYGQLGYGGTSDKKTPVDVSGLQSGVAVISAGASHTCAVLSSGAAKCWGQGKETQLGDGSNNDRTTPVDVVGLQSGVASITAGRRHTCALLLTGRVKCWGFGQYLGNGSIIGYRSTPVDVSSLSSGVVAISAGYYHVCALLQSGAAMCWGSGSYGQVGDGSTNTALTPVNVVGLQSGVAVISAGGSFTCAVLLSGSAKCWGMGLYGALGYGGNIDQSQPIDVQF
jgi:alpha-tubulin suppressor-like RCC1 family protein